MYFKMFIRSRPAFLLLWSVAASAVAWAQFGPPPGPPPQPRAGAPIDLTGYWVSLVTEDWRSRMTMPPKGDAESVPLNAAGKAAAEAWDPAKDEAAGEQCRSYGVAGLMR